MLPKIFKRVFPLIDWTILSFDLGGGGSAPAPDPAIGQAAMQNAEVAKEMAGVAREQLAYQKQRDAQLAPIFTNLVNQDLATSQANNERATEAWQRYKDTGIPVENSYLKSVADIGTEADQNAAAGRAVQDVNTQYDSADAQAQRDAARAGVAPSSSASLVGRRLSLLSRAGAAAGAATRARENQRLLGLSAQQGAANFVRGLPSQGLAADAAALNAGNSATNALNAQEAGHNAGVSTAGSLYGGSADVGQSGANILLNQFRSQTDAYNAEQQREGAAWGGLGSLVGSGIGAYAALGGFKKGGRVRAPRMIGYVSGGRVVGPGGPTEDAVPAMVDGQHPAALSSGEFVVKADSADAYGDEAMHDVNDGKALVIPSRVLSSIGRNQVRGLVLAMAQKPRRAPVTINQGA